MRPREFNFGVAAHKAGLRFMDNPYLRGTTYSREGRVWVDGYVASLISSRRFS